MKRKTYTKTEVREILRDIRDYVSGTDNDVSTYIKAIIDSL